jgi:SAM-dependent methyltransferase
MSTRLRLAGTAPFRLVQQILTRRDQSVSGDESIPPIDVTALWDGLFANEALAAVLSHCEFGSVLDIGSGAGRHADILEAQGKDVTAIDFGRSVYFQQKRSRRREIIGNYYEYKFRRQFDLVWASHVLEHQPNPNLFLRKIHADLKEDGWLAITVPPLKHEIVGGHVTLWNAGLLLYQLIMAGFDCREAWIKKYWYNISVIVKKKSIRSLPELHYDSGDIDRLQAFFPAGCGERFDGDIAELNWPASPAIAVA